MKKAKKKINVIREIVEDKLKCVREIQRRGYEITDKGIATLADTAAEGILEYLGKEWRGTEYEET